MADRTNPADAIVAHHAEMVRELQRRADQLIATVARGAPSVGAASAGADYFVATILPHALAEEKTLYAAVAPVERRLIESLTSEHAALRRLGSELTEASEGNDRVAIVGALSQLFALHAAKENEFVLPTPPATARHQPGSTVADDERRVRRQREYSIPAIGTS